MILSRSLTLDEVPEDDRVYGPGGARVAAFYRAYEREDAEERITDYEVKVWRAGSGEEVRAEIFRYAVDHAAGTREGLPVQALEFGADGRELLVHLGLRGRYTAEGHKQTVCLELP